MTRVFIDGKEGTTGLRIYERIAQCADITLLTLDDAARKNAEKRKEIINASDITFLCLPDDAAREAVFLASGAHTRIIDASSAHRTEPNWNYGLPEWKSGQRANIAAGMRTAVPGCHASGFIALVSPLLQAGVLAQDVSLSCQSITGYSGGGKSLIATYQNEARDAGFSSPRPYALGQAHKHLREMQAIAGISCPPVFTPILGDFYAGMLVMVPLHKAQLNKQAGIAGLQAIYEEHYANEPVVRVLPYTGENGALSSNRLSGRDDMEILITGNEERFLLTACYDNLGKGASGAAVQCMNIMLGRNETDTLCLG